MARRSKQDTMLSAPKRIALITAPSEYSFGRRKARGIIHYAKKYTNWEFITNRNSLPFLSVKDIKDEKVDGVIADIFSEGESMRLKELGVPVVNASSGFAGRVFPTVCPDNKAIGRMAADHLLQRKLDHFCFFGVRDRLHSLERLEGFREEVERQECTCESHMVEIPPGRMGVFPKSISDPSFYAEVLGKVPKPVGVMSLTDRIGMTVLKACAVAGLKSPDDVALISVDNDEMLCELATPNLTSIDSCGMDIGEKAAQTLDQLMIKGAEGVPMLTKVPPAQVVFRNSSNIILTKEPLVAEALRYIRTHAGEDIRAFHVANVIPYSKRWLEHKFTEELGHGIFEEIRLTHMKLAKRMLEDTELSRSEVGRQAGFPSLSRFEATFKQYTGMTPMAYRESMGKKA